MVVVSYGITSRVAQRAIDVARQKGEGRRAASCGLALSGKEDSEMAPRAKAFVVAELNYGQIVHEVERRLQVKRRSLLLGTSAAPSTFQKTYCKRSWRWRNDDN